MIGRVRQSVWGRSYRDLRIKSDYRVHEVSLGMIERRFASVSALKVLDIASGTGAFARRLADRFPAWELQINDFEGAAATTSFRRYKVDLNSQFAGSFESTGYELIVAIEIIEHLENPWNFLREIRKLLRPQGVLLLSTPNVDSTLDRLTYLVHGHAYYFGERGYLNSDGHITAVPDWLFRRIAKSCGYADIERSDLVDTGPLVAMTTILKSLLVMPLSTLFMQNKNNRSINIYVCR